MIDFLLKYWRIILEACFLIVSFILFMVRKKPIKLTDSIKTQVISFLPKVIKYCENWNKQLASDSKLSGLEKLTMALSMVNTFLIDECGLSESELPLYHDFIVNSIEEILSTPQKKGE